MFFLNLSLYFESTYFLQQDNVVCFLIHILNYGQVDKTKGLSSIESTPFWNIGIRKICGVGIKLADQTLDDSKLANLHLVIIGFFNLKDLNSFILLDENLKICACPFFPPN